MNQLLKLLSTAAAGALDVWVGIITGVALGLSPASSGAVSIASALAGVTLVVAIGGRLQHLIYRSRYLAKRRERTERVWRRYGIPGVALQAPLLTGPLLATLLALALGAPARSLLLWMLASVVFWGVVLTGAAALGFSLAILALAKYVELPFPCNRVDKQARGPDDGGGVRPNNHDPGSASCEGGQLRSRAPTRNGRCLPTRSGNSKTSASPNWCANKIPVCGVWGNGLGRAGIEDLYSLIHPPVQSSA